ncbi:MAG: hypothetical protein WC998_04090 [Candidatus Paceibacterota bacterium]|jgi:hypothetical protein
MGSSARLMAAGVASIIVLVAGAIYIIIVGPIFSKIIPFLHQNTPEVYWQSLGGGNVEWFLPFVYFLIVGVCIIKIIALVTSATQVVEYDSGGY